MNDIKTLNQYYGLERPDIEAVVPLSCKTILEVGCGFGNLGKALIKRQDCTVDGVEINSEASLHLENKYRKFWIGDVEKVEMMGALPEYDCVIFPDVLEHLNDPWRVLGRLVNKVKKGGYVVASIPNIRNLAILYRLVVQGQWKYEPSGILDRGHLRFFTKDSIRQLFEENPLKIEVWYAKRDRYAGSKRILAETARLAIPDIDVCQYIVRAKKI